jgi:PAS domain S-box-containing protein
MRVEPITPSARGRRKLGAGGYSPETLDHSETQLRTLFESIDEGFCIVEMIFDAAGQPLDYRFLEVNSIFEQQTGLANATGRRMRWLRPHHEQHWFQIYGRVALTGEPVRFENHAEALDARWFHVYAFRIGQPEQRRVAILFRDITASKRAEDAMRASQSQLQTLFDAAPLGIYLVDSGLHIRQVNPTARLAFGDIPNIIGRNFDEVIHTLWPKAFADEIVVRFRHTLVTGEPYVEPERIEQRRDRGVTECYEWQVNRIALAEGGFGVVCYVRDISAQVRAREALAESDRQKDTFIATLSHELRNPLTSINNAASLLRSPKLGAPDREWAAQVVQRQSRAMGVLLDDLLDISRLTLGRFTVQKRSVPLLAVLEAALEATRPVIDAAKHTLSTTMPPASVVLDADPLRLGQVISNLLTNAAKYTDAGGHIALDVRVSSDEVVVSVTDNGIGIEPAAIPQMFKMFSQGAGALDRAAEGLGIGLALVRGIVELHGGWVKAESEGPGRGSRFTVGLPRSAEPAEPGVAGPEVSQQPGTTGRYRILIADDNADAALSVSMLLQLAGHETCVTTNGKAAMEEAERFAPHLAVLDIGMPDLNGYELARRIRAAPWGHDITLFAATGWGQEKDKRLAEEAGFDVHLTKPIDPDKLEALIDEHLGRRP